MSETTRAQTLRLLRDAEQALATAQRELTTGLSQTRRLLACAGDSAPVPTLPGPHDQERFVVIADNQACAWRATLSMAQHAALLLHEATSGAVYVARVVAAIYAPDGDTPSVNRGASDA